MKSKFGFIATLFLFALCFNNASGQVLPYPSSGCTVSPACVQWGRYANQIAVFDGTGTLNVLGNCNTCLSEFSVLNVVQVTLTPAQVKNLNTIPDTLLPAPGPRLTYNILQAYASLSYNSVPYATDSVLAIYLNTGGNISFTPNVLTKTTNYTDHFIIAIDASVGFPTNQALLISTLGTNPTAGNSPVTITVYYSLMPTPF